VDDTVLTAANSHPYFFRRSRGFAPRFIHLPGNEKMVLAASAELKNTFCLAKEDYAFVSHHIGDLKNYETYQAFTEGIAHYCNIFKVSPQQVACDLHPDYLSTKFAHEWSDKHAIPLIPVQHHHAHLASCLADNAYFDDAPVIGIIFDGTGYGTDGNIWGGEIFVGNAKAFNRVYHLEPMPLPGGDSAVVKPSRIAIAYLLENNFVLDPNLMPVRATEETELTVLKKQISSRLNTPLTSSMGRLFDVVASLIGLRQSVSYEAQAAIELEQIVDPQVEAAYPIYLSGEIIKIDSLLQEILADLRSETPASTISAKFHNGLARLVVDLSRLIKANQKINTVALSGGVWQNIYLLEKTIALLESAGFTVLTHRQVPANDGGISLGQAAILNALNKELR
jgi:hydrogenase maturation protein HypF